MLSTPELLDPNKVPELPDIDIEALMGGDHTEWESEVALVHIAKALVVIAYELREIRKLYLLVNSH